MGLLDFLKKNKTEDAAAPSQKAVTTQLDAAETGSVTTLEGASVDAESNEVVADGSSEAAQSEVDSAPVQPTTVARAENPLRVDAERAERPATVRVFDEFGRQVEIPLADWREMMLAAAKKSQDDAERLYGIVLDALQVGLGEDVLQAARRLQEIDPDTERSTTMLGIVLMETGDATGAAKLFEEFETERRERGEGPSGVVLVNHAKALVTMGEQAAGEAMLWQALEADPNQENGLGWFGSIAAERGGESAYAEAMQRAAELPGAWRPQVWLARAALERNDLARAKALYAVALERAGTPAPAVLLQSMSGDLGKHGALQDALVLTRPAYDAAVHGLPVGNNLIKASLDSGRLADARAMVEELQAQGRPDWAQTLQFWEMEIKRAELAKEGPLPTGQPELTALAIEGPVWLPASSPARALFPAAKRGKLLFMAASVSYAEQPTALQGMLPDAQGRLSRALPLFLAESAFLHMGVDATAIMPWVKGHGFAVMGGEWSDADAAEYARNGGAEAAVALHIQQTGEKTEVRMRVVRADAEDGEEPVRTAVVPVDSNQAGAAAIQLWSQMAHSILQVTTEAQGESAAGVPLDAARYQIPKGAELGNYLLRLEQLLAVRCAGSEEPGRSFLTGEREIVNGQLHLALQMPESLPLRLILHETLLRMRDLRPEIVSEVRQPVGLLQERHGMRDPEANEVLLTQLRMIYPT